jgi:serine phosphatase RsbU (regulator of sigma subunit)
MLSVTRIALEQGSRYTHWTVRDKIAAPLIAFNGNQLNAETNAHSLLLMAIVYAVYRFMQESGLRQSSLEQEFKSARELQQVLIPETLPSLPGFTFTSAYRPAQEVGGDLFQVIPPEGAYEGSTLFLLGDVSGKGLKAAMTVSLIVGAARTLARFVPRPGEMLSELNLRLFGRLQGGFATCLAVRLGPEGQCVIASAGHPAPYLNKHEVDLPGALPLGVVATARYDEKSIDLKEGDHFALYTDGLLEARGANGEIFSFERLDALFSARPNAARAINAAVDFGQEDDITVLTLPRLVRGEESTSQLIAPVLAG